MDIINLAGIHKYNAVSIFQRVSLVLFRFIIGLNSSRQSWAPVNSHSNKKMYWLMLTKRVYPQSKKRMIEEVLPNLGGELLMII